MVIIAYEATAFSLLLYVQAALHGKDGGPVMGVRERGRLIVCHKGISVDCGVIFAQGFTCLEVNKNSSPAEHDPG